MKSFFRVIIEATQIFLIALAIVVPIRYFLFQPVFVSGASMEPNFASGDYILVNEISFRLRDPERGEVIIFKNPQDESHYFIKRIIGLPGETIEIKDKKIKIYNIESPGGKIIQEDYIDTDNETDGNLKVLLEEKEYFVLGDNRGHSSDSRKWGSVPRDNIIGKAWISISTSDGFSTIPSVLYK